MRSLSRTIKDKTSGTSKPVTGTPEIGMKEETPRTSRPSAGAGEVLSGIIRKGKMRDWTEEADKEADKKAEDDDGEMVQRPWSQFEDLSLSGHSNALWSRLWQVEQTCLRPHISPSNRALYLHPITGRFQF